jgi:hypothetical protein
MMQISGEMRFSHQNRDVSEHGGPLSSTQQRPSSDVLAAGGFLSESGSSPNHRSQRNVAGGANEGKFMIPAIPVLLRFPLA